MKRIFQLVALGLVSLMFAGSAWAVSAGHNIPGFIAAPNPTGQLDDTNTGISFVYNDMVSVAEDGRGDLLIYPLAIGVDEFSTKFTVVNTNQNASQIAKFVLREEENSNEVLDFYIYLSPADEWTGHLYYDAEADQIKLYSSDDSIETTIAGTGDDWASPNNPFDATVEDGADFTGYATVYNVATTQVVTYWNQSTGLANPTAPWTFTDQSLLNNRGAAKQDIYDWFWNQWLSPGLVSADLSNEAPAISSPQNNIARTGPSANVPPRSVRAQRNFNRNQLSGWMDLSYGNATPPFEDLAVASAALRATTLKDFHVSTRPTAGDDLQLQNASRWNNLNEVEAVLAKSSVILPFSNTDNKQSMHFFSFPTKIGSNIFGTWGPGIQHRINAFNLQEKMLRKTTSPFAPTWDNEVDYYTMTAEDEVGLDGDNIYKGQLWEEGWMQYVPVDTTNQRNQIVTGLLTANATNFNPNNAPAWRLFPNPVGDFLNVSGLPMLATHLTIDGYGLSLSKAANTDSFSIVTQGGLGAADFSHGMSKDPRAVVNKGWKTTGTIN